MLHRHLAPYFFITVVVDDRLQTLGKMAASDELTDAQVRQLLFDLDSSYQAFNQLLHST